MRIGNCTTDSNPQWGSCRVFFIDISVSLDALMGRRIGIALASATWSFLFLTKSFVIFSFENFLIYNKSVYGVMISRNGRHQQFQPSAEERTASKCLLEASLNHKTFMCSFRKTHSTFVENLFGPLMWGRNKIPGTKFASLLALGLRKHPRVAQLSTSSDNILMMPHVKTLTGGNALCLNEVPRKCLTRFNF